MNDGFIDGNKRVGFAATYVLMRIDGFVLNVTGEVALRFVIGNLDAATFRKDVLDAWLRAHLVPTPE